MYFSSEQRQQLEAEYVQLNEKYLSLLTTYSNLQFKNSEAYEYARHGFMRRLGTLKRCIENIYALSPPDRDEKPSREECVDLGINLQSFVLNLFGSFDNFLYYSLNDFVEYFINEGRYAEAFRIAALILKGLGKGSDMKGYHYKKTLAAFSTLPAEKIPAYISLLVQTLGQTIEQEVPEERDDYSMGWRTAIETHEQNWQHDEPKNVLVNSIRDTLTKYLENKKREDIASSVEGLIKWNIPYSIFIRLKFYFYRLHPAAFMQEIEKSVVEQFDKPNLWHEYFLLMEEIFSRLNKETQEWYLEMVEGGPPSHKDDERYVHHWKSRRLAPILKHLSLAQVKKYEDLIKSAKGLSRPDLASYHTGIMRGPISPVAEPELGKMSIPDLVEYISTWQPPSEWLSASRNGLARELSNIVCNNTISFSTEAEQLSDIRIRPVYISYFFSGLREGLKKNPAIDWDAVLSLAITLVERAKAEILPVFKSDSNGDEWETEWSYAFQELAQLLEAGLHSDSSGLNKKHQEDVWEIIEFLCENPEPSIEEEQKSHGVFTLSLNTVRGRAFHALFAYIFWHDRQFDKEKDRKSRIPQEAKDILERHLNTAHEPGSTIRSVYGRYFPWLFAYDPPWATQIIDELFPKEDRERRYAAWETYLSTGQLFETYTVLRPQYHQAISEIRSYESKSGRNVDALENLANHISVAYAYRLETDKGSTWEKFFKLAPAKQRGQAISFMGRGYLYRDTLKPGEELPDISRLQEFWEWRLHESKDIEELKQFGWWARAGYFNDKWMLERLIETLNKTKGDIIAEYEILETLAVLASDFSILCAEALSHVVLSRSTDRFTLGHDKSIEHTLRAIYASKDKNAVSIAEKIIDHLTKMGFEKYRSIPTENHEEKELRIK